MVAGIRAIALTLAVVAVCGMAFEAQADDPPDLFLEHLLDFEWTGGGGTTDWKTSANWTAPTFPGDYPYTPLPTYPDDPGRVEDPDDTLEGGAMRTITPVVGADISGNFAIDRTVNITGGGDVTVASLKMGGTGATAVTTAVTSSGGRLVFENGEANDRLTNPGDPEADPEIRPEPIYGFNQGHALLWSTGTVGTVEVNRIDADIQPNDDLDIEGDRDLHIYGDIYEGPTDLDPGDGIDQDLGSSISNLMSGGATLYIHGNINTANVDENPAEEGTQDRQFSINSSRGDLVPEDPQNPPDPISRRATVDIDGELRGAGNITIKRWHGAPTQSQPDVHRKGP